MKELDAGEHQETACFSMFSVRVVLPRKCNASISTPGIKLLFRSLLRVAQHVCNLKCFAVLPELIISHYYYNLMII